MMTALAVSVILAYIFIAAMCIAASRKPKE
jgi:hypothetical protein